MLSVCANRRVRVFARGRRQRVASGYDTRVRHAAAEAAPLVSAPPLAVLRPLPELGPLPALGPLGALQALLARRHRRGPTPHTPHTYKLFSHTL